MNIAFIPARFSQVAFAFYMAGIMAFLMSVVLVAVNTGLDVGFWARVARSYCVAMPIAFCCVLMVRPVVVRLLALTVKPSGDGDR